MLIGHYASAFLARAYEKRLPLGAALVAAQLIDIFWDLFILTGIERARLVPGLPTNPLDLYFMPYTHGLLAALAWAALVFIGIKATGAFGGSTRVGLWAAGAVAAHWGLDLIVHRHDLPLLGDATPKLGFALWNQPGLALSVEIFLFVAAVLVYLRKTGESPRWIGGFAAGLVAVQISTVLGPLPPTIPAMAGSLLVFYFVVAWIGHVVQRRAARTAGR